MTIGRVKNNLLLVVYTKRNDKKRIISTRLASRDEHRMYINPES